MKTPPTSDSSFNTSMKKAKSQLLHLAQVRRAAMEHLNIRCPQASPRAPCSKTFRLHAFIARDASEVVDALRNRRMELSTHCPRTLSTGHLPFAMSVGWRRFAIGESFMCLHVELYSKQIISIVAGLKPCKGVSWCYYQRNDIPKQFAAHLRMWV